MTMTTVAIIFACASLGLVAVICTMSGGRP